MTRQNVTYLCDGGPHTLQVPRPECPNAAAHTPCPTGYGAWWEWVEQMKKTHKPTQCPDCGYWVLCVPRSANSPESGQNN